MALVPAHIGLPLRRVAVSASTVAVAVAALISVGPAVAMASCIPNRPAIGNQYQVGWSYGQVSDWDGIEANIENYYNPHVHCAGGTSYTWVMLYFVPNQLRWAQIGPQRDCNHSTNIYAQWIDGGTPLDMHWTILPDVWDTYKVTYNTSNGEYRFWVNGVNKLNTAPLSWAPNDVAAIGEITWLDSQMMGDPLNDESVGNVQERENGVWIQSPGGYFVDDGNYFAENGNCKNFNFWDPCPT